MEDMTVGRSWDGSESLLQRSGELAASLTGTPYVPMLRAFGGLLLALLGLIQAGYALVASSFPPFSISSFATHGQETGFRMTELL